MGERESEEREEWERIPFSRGLLVLGFDFFLFKTLDFS